jgi:ankyrin repeat protein
MTDQKDSKYVRTLLSLAAGNRHTKVVQLLLNAEEAKDSAERRTPLSWAAGNAHTEMVQLLLNAEATSKQKTSGTEEHH